MLPGDATQLLHLSSLCLATNSLPRAGGLLDQSNLEVQALIARLNAESEKANADAKKSKPRGAK